MWQRRRRRFCQDGNVRPSTSSTTSCQHCLKIKEGLLILYLSILLLRKNVSSFSLPISATLKQELIVDGKLKIYSFFCHLFLVSFVTMTADELFILLESEGHSIHILSEIYSPESRLKLSRHKKLYSWNVDECKC